MMRKDELASTNNEQDVTVKNATFLATETPHGARMQGMKPLDQMSTDRIKTFISPAKSIVEVTNSGRTYWNYNSGN